jgi:ABC-type microcin C transport system duplicated ATPase subunit YejF
MDGCMQGGINVRIIDSDPLSIINDFASNVNIVYNGEKKNQNQLLNELYYKDYNKYNRNTGPSMPPQNPLLKKHVDIPDEPKPIEPGQVDPAAFFGSSLKGLF